MTADIWLWPIAVLLLGYLLGSIPFGLMLTRFAGGGDLRKLGSGNIGATNVLRTGHKGLAAATLALDAAKGAAAVLIVRGIDPDLSATAAVGAFFGHLFPVWLKGRGGKGVATLLGLSLALSWPAGIAFAGVWLGTIALTRYSSAGGIAAAVVLPLAAALLGQFDLSLLFLAFALMVIWRHRANIERLLAGTEPRIGTSAVAPDPL